MDSVAPDQSECPHSLIATLSTDKLMRSYFTCSFQIDFMDLKLHCLHASCNVEDTDDNEGPLNTFSRSET